MEVPGEEGDMTVCTDMQLLQSVLNKSSVVIPAGHYSLSSDIQIPSNRSIWVQKGAVITITGGRFTAYVPHGGNIDFRIDGVMSFVATTTAPSQGGLAGWDYNVLYNNRGIIELGGSVKQPATNIHVYGTGKVCSDYVWPGSPPSAYTDMHAQLNRKGVCLFEVVKSSISGLEVHNVYGEAVYCQAVNPSLYDVRLVGNRVHEVAFNGVNFNALGGQGFVASDNYIQNAWQGVEFSVGRCERNHILGVYRGIMTGGGGGAGPLHIIGNVIRDTTYPIDVAFNPGPVENVIVKDNVADMINGDVAFSFENINNYILADNIVVGNCKTYRFTNCGPGSVDGKRQ
jgi:hypothetical protein